ncbi:MAG: DUF2628 domain-containing protein [Rickettsiales bacterium]
MKLYNGLIKYGNKDQIDDVIIVDNSFSFKALIFNPLWFFYHRMWREFLLLILLSVVIALFPISETDILLIQIALYFAIALNSRTWLIDHLVKRKKYQQVAMVFANNITEAKLKFINQIITKKSIQNEDAFEQIIKNIKK